MSCSSWVACSLVDVLASAPRQRSNTEQPFCLQRPYFPLEENLACCSPYWDFCSFFAEVVCQTAVNNHTNSRSVLALCPWEVVLITDLRICEMSVIRSLVVIV